MINTFITLKVSPLPNVPSTLKTFLVFGKYLFVVSPGNEYPGDAIDEAEDEDDEAGDDESEVELVGLHKYVPAPKWERLVWPPVRQTVRRVGRTTAARPIYQYCSLLTAVTPSSFPPAATSLPLCRIINQNCPHNFGTATEGPTQILLSTCFSMRHTQVRV